MTPKHDTAAGLYIHVPFCASVCPYCDFAVTITNPDRRASYLLGVPAEATMRAGMNLVFDTVYFGGGTPSRLSGDQLEGLLLGIRGHLDVLPVPRVFLEVNPEDVTANSVAAWRSIGVDTISLGVQSFDDEILRYLGRRHTVDQSRRALDMLQNSDFSTISIDLIYGVEGQTVEAWQRGLDEAADRLVDHLSCYQLTFHSGTIFGRRLADGQSAEVPTDAQAEFFLLTHLMLADHGYDGYEVSSFASAPEHRSAHNQKYWSHEPYLGLGPSAHSFVGRRRWWNRRKLRLWQRDVDGGRLPEGGSEDLTDTDLALEAVMLGLRTREGVDVGRLRHRFDLDLVAVNQTTVDRLCEDGHLELEGGMLRPTLTGMAIADTLARSLDVSTNGRPSS